LWTPALLFADGEPGVWYDPSDFSTMFQDSAGTTPVTAVEQPVGLILDKSKGLALGPDALGGAGAFSSAGSWSVGAGWSIGSGVATAASAANMSIASVLTIGKWYKITLEVTAFTSGTLYAGTISNLKAMPTGTGTKTAYFLADATTFYLAGLTAFNGTVDNVVVTDIAGNHASQSTSASRPVLSARVNLLTYSEQFDNAAWTKTNTTVTANATIAPDGTTTADELFTTAATAAFIISQNITIGAGSTALIYAKASGTGFFQLSYNGDTTSYANFNLSTGVLGTSTGTVTHSIESVGSGWFKLAVVNTSTAVTGIRWTIVSSAAASRAQTFAGTGAESIYIWGADLRVTNVGSNMPVYQRVGAATYGTSTVAGNPDYDTSGFPFFLGFNGSTGSRWMVSSTITPGTDKAQVFAGVRKLSDAAQGVVSELSATIASNNGSFSLTAPNSAAANYNFSSKGTTQTDSTVATYTAPITNVLSGLADIASASNLFRVNGAQVGSALTTQGTGNYLAYPLYIGARAGTGLYYNGNLYSLIVRFGPNLSEATIDQTEVWVGDKTGLNLSFATQQTIFDRFNATVLDRLSAIILQRY
jgi:hypothetical protein